MKKTISETIRFLDAMKSGVIKLTALVQIKRALESALHMRVFVNSMNDIYSIENVKELIDLIKGDDTPRRGSYNPFYRKWKKFNAPFPHEISGRMKSATSIKIVGNSVQLEIPDSATTKKGWNYGPKHEKRKSILKATVFFAWSDIIDGIYKSYKEFIENG